MLPELPSLYWYLVLARIILVLLPQSGYIHPDEFFQSVEIQAGRVFEVEHVVPWEFNSTFPIRSLAIPYVTIGMIYSFVKGRHQLLPTVRSIKGLMMVSYIAPLLILSIFPHQEPRFLIPLIIPLIYLHSSDILPEKDNILIKLEHVVKKPKTSMKTPTNIYMKLWLIVNTILVIFYGFLHQGGVYKVANFLSRDMRVGSLRNEYYVVSSHIYSLPESLFLQKSSDKLHYSKSTKYAVTKRYFLHEEGSTDLDVLVKDIQTIYRKIEGYKHNKTKKRYKMFLIIPSSLEDQFSYLAANSQIALEKVRTFYPHISTEAFPELAQDFLYLYSNFKWQEFQTSLLYGLSRIVSSFGLILYEIKIY